MQEEKDTQPDNGQPEHGPNESAQTQASADEQAAREDAPESAHEPAPHAGAETGEQPAAEADEAGQQAGEAPSEEVNQLQERLLRIQAEYDNFRRRTKKEKEQIREQVHGELLNTMLPVFDDLDRSLSIVESAEDLETLRQGIRSAHKKFRNSLERQGVTPLPVEKGQDFDENLHDAVAGMPVEDDELKGKIVEVVENGYQLNDKIIRFAKVIIGE